MTGIVPDWAVAPLKAFYGAKYDTFDWSFLMTLPGTYNKLKYSAISYLLACVFLLEIKRDVMDSVVKSFSTSIGSIYTFD